MWTLKHIPSGVEKSLADWSISADFSLSGSNKQRRTLTVTIVALFDSAAAFAFLDPVILYRDRTAVGAGGTIAFQGYLMADAQRAGSGGEESLTYIFANAWWLLERHIFQQTRKTFAGYVTPGVPSSGATTTDEFLPEVFLGEKADETYQTNGQQIAEIVTWANRCYNPTRRGATAGMDAAQDILQLGTIEPAVNIPKSRDTNLHCSEAIVQLLRWSPDAVVKIDETTTPPTLHVLSYAGQPEKIINITTAQAEQIRLAPQNDLNVPGIIIYQTRVSDFNGQQWADGYVDKFPVDLDKFTPGIETHFIELAGASTTTVEQRVTAVPVADAVSGVAATRLSWWLNDHDNTLKDPLIDETTIVVGVASVKEAIVGGGDISLEAFPRETDDPIQDWMTGVSSIRAEFIADVSYTRFADAGKKIHSKKITKRQVRCTRTLTNAVSQTYSAVSAAATAEAFLTGIAEAVYTARNVPQFSGSLSLVASEVPADIFIGQRITLVAPDQTFTKLPLQSIELRPHFGKITLGFAPVAPLEVSARIELAKATRFRKIYRMPSGRATGASAGGNTVDGSGKSPASNTSHGSEDVEVHAVNAVVATGPNKFSGIMLDAGGGTAPGATVGQPSIVIARKAADGAVDTEEPQVLLHHQDLNEPLECPATSDLLEIPIIKYRLVRGCMDVSGTTREGFWLIPISQFYIG